MQTPKMAVVTVIVVVSYIGAVSVLTDIADLSRATGLLLALVWLPLVFGALWLAGAFDRPESTTSESWPDTIERSEGEHEAGESRRTARDRAA